MKTYIFFTEDQEHIIAMGEEVNTVFKDLTDPTKGNFELEAYDVVSVMEIDSTKPEAMFYMFHEATGVFEEDSTEPIYFFNP